MLYSWGGGWNNRVHTNAVSDIDPGMLTLGSHLTYLYQDDGTDFMNFSSNIMYEVKGRGISSGGVIKSIESVFEVSAAADLCSACSTFARHNLVAAEQRCC